MTSAGQHQTEGGTDVMDARSAVQARPSSGSAPCSPPSMTLRARRWPTAILDRGCARRPRGFRSGQRNGPQPNKETLGRLDTPAGIRERAITPKSCWVALRVSLASRPCTASARFCLLLACSHGSYLVCGRHRSQMTSVESRASWVAACVTLAILSVAYGSTLLIVVGFAGWSLISACRAQRWLWRGR